MIILMFINKVIQGSNTLRIFLERLIPLVRAFFSTFVTMKKLLLILFLLPLVNIAQNMHSGGGEYNLDSHQSCLSDQDRLVIWDEIKENLKSLKNQNIITKRNQSVSFVWPLRKDTSLAYNNYFGISNFVDQDTTTGSILDYNCLNRSYDGMVEQISLLGLSLGIFIIMIISM